MRFGKEIGRYFIYGALLLLGIEMWIGKGVSFKGRNIITGLINKLFHKFKD